MWIFSVRELSFICILSIGLLSQAFGQSLVLDDSIADIPPHMIEIFPEPLYGTNGFKNWIYATFGNPPVEINETWVKNQTITVTGADGQPQTIKPYANLGDGKNCPIHGVSSNPN